MLGDVRQQVGNLDQVAAHHLVWSVHKERDDDAQRAWVHEQTPVRFQLCASADDLDGAALGLFILHGDERKKCAVISFYVRGDFLSCPFAHDPGYDVLLGYEINEQYRHAWSLNHPGGTCRVQDILALSPADFVQDAESHGAFTGEYDELLLMFTPDCSSGSSADGIPVDLAYYERVMKHAIDVIRVMPVYV